MSEWRNEYDAAEWASKNQTADPVTVGLDYAHDMANLRAENERLREALEEVVGCFDDGIVISKETVLKACAALANST